MVWVVRGLGRILTLLVLLLSGLAAPRAGAFSLTDLMQPFDAARLDRDEARFLQTGLAFSGDYVGVIDGRWGAGSQRALAAWRRRAGLDENNLAAVLLGLESWIRFEEEGWQSQYMTSLDMSLLVPLGRTVEDRASDSFINYRHQDSSLGYSLTLGDDAQVIRLHSWAMGEASAGGAPYLLRRADTLITSVRQADGRSLYVRSDLRGRRWATVMLSAGPGDAGILAAVSASIRKGDAGPLRLPETGLLSRGIEILAGLIETDPGAAPPDLAAIRRDLEGRAAAASAPAPVAAPAAPEAEPAPAEPEFAEPEDGAGQASGSGFVVSARGDVLTNAHVAAGCRGLTVAGQPARLTASDEGFDLALLAAPDLAGRTVARFAPRAARLNSDITVTGYPLNGILGGLNVTRGAVTGLRGLQGDPVQMQISAPVQPGNSGGPVVNAAGAVVGVVVAKLDAGLLSELTGDIAQNVNFAIRAEIGRLFLTENGVDPLLSDTEAPLPPEDLASASADFTVLIECF